MAPHISLIINLPHQPLTSLPLILPGLRRKPTVNTEINTPDPKVQLAQINVAGVARPVSLGAWC